MKCHRCFGTNFRNKPCKKVLKGSVLYAKGTDWMISAVINHVNSYVLLYRRMGIKRAARSQGPSNRIDASEAQAKLNEQSRELGLAKVTGCSQELKHLHLVQGFKRHEVPITFWFAKTNIASMSIAQSLQ